MLTVLQSVAGRLGFALADAVVAFTAELEAHKLTVGVPAPTAHPLVETIVRLHSGAFTIVDDEAGEPAPQGARTYKADIWRRATDAEAEMIAAALASQPLRKRKIFEDAV